MTTENQVQTEQVQTEQTPVEKEYTPTEVEAIEQGWIPKEEFDGDPDKFIDAAEFIRRGELFRKIESQSKRVKQLEKALEAFQIHHSKVAENEYKRALKALQDERKQAFLEGEHEKAFALEEKIEEVKAEAAQIQNVPKVQEDRDEYSQEFTNWVQKNQWYETNQLMRGAADTLGKELYNSGLSPSEVLREVEKQIRQEFAHKFKATSKPAPVEGSTRSGRPSSEKFSMTDDERKIMNKIIAVTPGFTEEHYIKELKATRN